MMSSRLGILVYLNRLFWKVILTLCKVNSVVFLKIWVSFLFIFLRKLPYGSLTETCGTSVYIAPEIRNGNRFNLKADIYSSGVTYYEMCSKPMTESEKILTFPILAVLWRNINFGVNNYNKKNLLKTLLHDDHNLRPTCDQILKILNSEKSLTEIKDVIQLSRKISNQEWRTFERTLKSTNLQNEELTNFFLKTAAQIFEIHGGQNIPMPTFLPCFNNHTKNLTPLLNTSGNFSSISNTSRIPFSYYLTAKKIKKIRRYSIGKVFEEGVLSPVEIQECLFQAVDPEPNDRVTDAEILYIAQRMCDKFIPNESDNIYFIMNHGLIFSLILKHCRISQKDYFSFFANMRDLTKVQATEAISASQLNSEVKTFLTKMLTGLNVSNAQQYLSNLIRRNNNEIFAEINFDSLSEACAQLKEIEINARKFGVTYSIKILPLLLNEIHSNFMFKIVLKNEVLASGGRFHSLIKTSRRLKKHGRFSVSAVDISFNVKNWVKFSNPLQSYSKSMDVIIVAKNKSVAIGFYSWLLSREIKCEIVKKVISSNKSKRPLLLIRMINELECTVFKIEENSTPWKLVNILEGDWTSRPFQVNLVKKLYSNSRNDLQSITFWQL